MVGHKNRVENLRQDKTGHRQDKTITREVRRTQARRKQMEKAKGKRTKKVTNARESDNTRQDKAREHTRRQDGTTHHKQQITSNKVRKGTTITRKGM